MGTPVPYRYISQLPKQAQVEIERDFLHLQTQIRAQRTVFDCVIDPTQPSDPTEHVYINLTELIANETWASGTTLHVGVYQPQGSVITEPADSLDITGNGDLVLFGILGQAPTNGGWEWAMLTAHAQTVIYKGLIINPTGTAF